ncbi:MAG TPA: LysM peptidoglycan-binding domain-containing protein, partial [Anaerolineae bacterium]|nr:LysM peptidoglycan-binding domain-containing protein [Anaerolineae bacterium]
MHKRKLDFIRLVPFVLLTLLLLPTIAHAAGATGEFGKEQPPAFDRLDTPKNSSDTRGFGYLYTVVAGDDLWLIATAHGLSMETLAEANDLTAPYWIYPDDKLWIPAAPQEVKRAPAPTPTPAPT